MGINFPLVQGEVDTADADISSGHIRATGEWSEGVAELSCDQASDGQGGQQDEH